MREEWKKCLDKYEVSTLGRVRNIRTGKMLAAGKGGRRYLTVQVYIGGKQRKKNVHVLVARAFLGRCPIGWEVDHRNENKMDAKLSNLQYVPHHVNVRLSAAKGRRNGNAKMSKEFVHEIRRLYDDGSTQKSLAKMFGISQPTVHQIVTEKTWV